MLFSNCINVFDILTNCLRKEMTSSDQRSLDNQGSNNEELLLLSPQENQIPLHSNVVANNN